MTDSEKLKFIMNYLRHYECMGAYERIESALKQKELYQHRSQLQNQQREPEKIKPLAQYLAEYVEQEVNNPYADPKKWSLVAWRELLEQALDAYQSTENVTIKIERNIK